MKTRIPAESCGHRDQNTPDAAISRFCEGVLLASGMAEEAYERYALTTGRRRTYLETFRAFRKRYPRKAPREILNDLIASTPRAEGKWFAAAKEAGLLDTALRLAESSPCDPITLSRAARDRASSDPEFAMRVSLAALRRIAAGYGYELTGRDVMDAETRTREAVENTGREKEVEERIRDLIAAEKNRSAGGGILSRFLG